MFTTHTSLEQGEMHLIVTQETGFMFKYKRFQSLALKMKFNIDGCLNCITMSSRQYSKQFCICRLLMNRTSNSNILLTKVKKKKNPNSESGFLYKKLGIKDQFSTIVTVPLF